MKLKKYIVLFLSLFIIVSCNNVSAIGEDNTNNQDVIYIPLDKKQASKDETVYVNLDPQGFINVINVVNRLSDVDQGYYEDFGDYSNVINLTSQDKITLNTNSIKIPITHKYSSYYYQTTLKNNYELPFNLSLTYYFEKREIAPTKLVGKKGIVDIIIKITSNPLANDYFKSNYLAQIQFPLNIDTNQLISAQGATKVIVGKTLTLAYMVLPGQNGEFRISINSEAFELEGFTATYSLFDFNSLGFDLALIPSYINELENGLILMKQGQISLKDGITSLANGLVQVSNGLNKLNQGEAELNSNASQYFAAIKEINTNLQLLNYGLLQIAHNGDGLSSGYNELQAGVLQLITTIEPLVQAIPATKNQLIQLKSGLATFGNGLNQYLNGVNTISANLNLLSTGMNTLASNSDLLEDGMIEIYQGSNALTSSMIEISNSTLTIPTKLDEMIKGQQEIIDGLNEARKLLENFNLSDTNTNLISFTSSLNPEPKSVQFIIKQEALTIRKA